MTQLSSPHHDAEPLGLLRIDRPEIFLQLPEIRQSETAACGENRTTLDIARRGLERKLKVAPPGDHRLLTAVVRLRARSASCKVRVYGFSAWKEFRSHAQRQACKHGFGLARKRTYLSPFATSSWILPHPRRPSDGTRSPRRPTSWC